MKVVIEVHLNDDGTIYVGSAMNSEVVAWCNRHLKTLTVALAHSDNPEEIEGTVFVPGKPKKSRRTKATA